MGIRHRHSSGGGFLDCQSLIFAIFWWLLLFPLAVGVFRHHEENKDESSSDSQAISDSSFVMIGTWKDGAQFVYDFADSMWKSGIVIYNNMTNGYGDTLRTKTIVDTVRTPTPMPTPSFTSDTDQVQKMVDDIWNDSDE